MGRGHGKRIVTHQTVGRKEPDAVRYKLQVMPVLAKRVKAGEDENKKTAYAKVVYRDVLNEERLAQQIAEQHPALPATTVKYVIDALTTTMKEELRRGRQITFSNLFSFGLAFEGRIDPSSPLDARHLPLRPWARFSSGFINEMNHQVRVAYTEPVQPPKVEVDGMCLRAGLIELKGSFHHYESIAADIMTADGNTIPCTISASKDGRLTRPSAKRLFVLTPEMIDYATSTLHLSWIDGGGDHQTLPLPLSPLTQQG